MVKDIDIIEIDPKKAYIFDVDKDIVEHVKLLGEFFQRNHFNTDRMLFIPKGSLNVTELRKKVDD